MAEDRPSAITGALGIATATLVVSVLITLAMGGWVFAFPFVLIVTLVIGLAIGMPVFLLLREGKRANWLSVGGGGFLTGAVVPALKAVDQASVKNEWILASGDHLVPSWIEAVYVISAFGAAGILGAYVAWFVIGWSSAGVSQRRKRSLTLAVSVVIAVAGAAALPWATRDRSCHNPMRDGHTSIGPIAQFQLHLPMSEWVALRDELERFARARNWSFQANIGATAEIPWFQVSLCTEPGTQIFAMQALPDSSYVIMDVFQPQGDASWQAPLRVLQGRLEARWPGAVCYEYGDYSAPRPPWAPPAPSLNPTPSSATH